MVLPGLRRVSTLVVDVGWSESTPRMLDDMNLWLVGEDTVLAVLIVEWKRVGDTNRVTGTAECYTRDSTRMPIRRQREQVFPAPAREEAEAQVFRFTRDMLSGGSGAVMFSGRRGDEGEVLTLRIEELRSAARNALGRMGLVPA
ncbi:hypothetical protein BDW62DRAFT_189276 [Aspergillus aurantiobrunneus]